MKNWLRRIRGAFGMGLLWAFGAAGVGMVIELLDNVLPGGFALASLVDIWPVVLGIVGFLGGALFSIVLGIAARKRRFHDLSLSKFAAWGALAGVLLGGFFMGTLGTGLVFMGVTALGSALAAAGTLALARFGEKGALPKPVETSRAVPDSHD